MNELRLWQPWRVVQLWRLWRVANLWRLWRVTQLRWVRPLAGSLAAVALVIGGLMAFQYQSAPAPPLWRIDNAPITKPLPPDHWPRQGN
ncbi:hypothetical protein [Nocardia brasiliensis]|uniref:hypothetical protein n=1 Tax=Nocardia brasiliensis TaxID=37326 RepID=UPI0036721502